MIQPRASSRFASQRLMLGLLGLALVMLVVLLISSLQRPPREAAPRGGEPLARLGLLPDAAGAADDGAVAP
ncbi:MAG: hypothetical protein ACMVO5_13425 [Polymorphobacter sp.]|uniref:hypothetical protein n=1 Tax=Polymorphobacter sp. TaxID=1909290 RepID=UPI003A862617